VDQVCLQVPRGSIYGFLGPNGAGKTTTIRLLLGLIRADAGEVRLFGESLRRNRLSLLRRVGSLVETPSLYPNLSGRENLKVIQQMVGAERTQIDWALHVMHLEDAADRRVGQYSLGMKQRLGLAAALLNAPELLILDEPTNGLDPAGIRQVRGLLRELPQEHGITVFLSSHLLAEVEQVATHIGIIHQGKLIFQGKREALHAQVEHQVLADVDQPQRAKATLQASGWQIRQNGDHRLCIAAASHSDTAMINRQLTQDGVNVYRLELAQPTLEDIFLELVESK
jgi:ABC-2 type transport system ATP-binding protein